jgi:hypothetical protein
LRGDFLHISVVKCGCFAAGRDFLHVLWRSSGHFLSQRRFVPVFSQKCGCFAATAPTAPHVTPRPHVTLPAKHKKTPGNHPGAVLLFKICLLTI